MLNSLLRLFLLLKLHILLKSFFPCLLAVLLLLVWSSVSFGCFQLLLIDISIHRRAYTKHYIVHWIGIQRPWNTINYFFYNILFPSSPLCALISFNLCAHTGTSNNNIPLNRINNKKKMNEEEKKQQIFAKRWILFEIHITKIESKQVLFIKLFKFLFIKRILYISHHPGIHSIHQDCLCNRLAIVNYIGYDDAK